jgi:hypothetical protein
MIERACLRAFFVGSVLASFDLEIFFESKIPPKKIVKKFKLWLSSACSVFQSETKSWNSEKKWIRGQV